MSTEPFIGEVKLFAFNFAPRGYALCEGQLLAISSNTALFSLIGTTYGGDGRTTFALPDLRGRMPIGQDQGPGLPNYRMGERGGTTQTNILTTNLPAHIHSAAPISVKMPVSSLGGEDNTPTGNFLAASSSEVYASAANGYYGDLQVSGETTATGGNIPLGIMNPFLVMNYSIATIGIFPSRQ
ncbi:phage tail protein [Algoriphagus sp. NG3]|uniref:phage tail protein n=1 Tax=Algoriphagus sp. NG3 TaxID=3097546 RepID=UPI002A825743|nr:tail fiber protein [Algoriphagus sp. NG3]WPR77200.1 tail fiber protein [Algoriphagus sp. NG3]